ncbi:HAD family hydrolase [Candidatus Bathyarchaeota archaeon]|nr:HAD family hydrolase [Candidatus Bathyarchaeota archaeon]
MKDEKCAIIFDLDNTLVDTYQVYYNAKLNLAKEIKRAGGSVEAPERFVGKIDQADRELCRKFNRPSYNPSHLVREICKITNCQKCNIEKLTRNYQKNIKKTPKLLENVKLVLEFLKEKGAYLILISEGPEKQKWKTLKNNGIDKLFDRIIFVEKDKENTYISTINELKNQGYAQIYCVGDSLEKDIAPGNAAGVSTVWIPSRWELPENEQEYKVKPTYRISKLKDIIRIFETLSEA